MKAYSPSFFVMKALILVLAIGFLAIIAPTVNAGYTLVQHQTTTSTSNAGVAHQDQNDHGGAGQITARKTFNVSRVNVTLGAAGGVPAGKLVMELYNNGFGFIENSTNLLDLSTYSGKANYSFDFPAGTTLTSGSNYWFSLKKYDDSFDAANYVSWMGGSGGANTGSIYRNGGAGFALWSANWNDTMWLYEYNTSAFNFTIGAIEEQGGGAINSFNATVTFNGTTTNYTTATGSITTNIKNGTGLANITVWSAGFFDNETLNHDTSNNLQVNLLRKEYFNITAYDTYNHTKIMIFNASVNGTLYNTTTGVITTGYHQKNGVVNITTSATNYFSNYTTNHSPATNLTDYITPYTAVYVFDFNGGSVNFSINYTTGGVTNTITTTTGYAYLPLYNNSYNLTVFDASNSTVDFSSTSANVSASPYLHSYNFTVYLSNSFYLVFYDEINNSLIRETVYFNIISDLYAENFSTNNGYLNVTLIVPEDYQFIYYREQDAPREYYTALVNQSFQNITLYLIAENVSSLYLPVVVDFSGDPCPDQIVSLYRYYVDDNGYKVVEMAKTSTNGEAVLRVQPNVINYKLGFAGSCGNFISDPQKIVSNTDRFTVDDAQSPLTSIKAVLGASTSLTFNNVTRTFVYTWSDTSNVISQGCLYVYRTFQGVRSLNNSGCTAASSGSQIYTLTGDLNNSIYDAQGILSTNTAYSDTMTNTESVSFLLGIAAIGLTGVFLVFLLIAGGVVGFANTAAGAVTVLLGALFVGIKFGLLAGAGMAVTSLLVLGVIILYKS